MWLELEELIIIHFPKFNTLGDNTNVLHVLSVLSSVHVLRVLEYGTRIKCNIECIIFVHVLRAYIQYYSLCTYSDMHAQTTVVVFLRLA